MRNNRGYIRELVIKQASQPTFFLQPFTHSEAWLFILSGDGDYLTMNTVTPTLISNVLKR